MNKQGPVESWNSMVKSLISAKKSWEEHKQAMRGVNPEILPIEAQRKLKFKVHRYSDFERMMVSFIELWRGTGGLESMEIITKETKNARSK